MVPKNKDQETNKKFIENKEIRIKYTPKIIESLKQNRILFEVLKIISHSEDAKARAPEELSYVPIDKDVFEKLKHVCKITNIPMKEIITEEIRQLLDGFIRENPLVFLNSFIGIENIEDPIAIVRKLKSVVNIPDDWMKELETTDPIEYVKKWTKL